MTRYLVKRLITAVFVVILVAVATFSLARILPGDVVVGQIADAGTVRKDEIDRIRAILGLDVPFHVQFWNWIKGLAVGDWGRSLVTNRSTLEHITKALPVTAELGAFSLIISLLIAMPVGLVSAIRADSPWDYVGRLVAIGGLSFPEFWLATLMLVFLPIIFNYGIPVMYTSPFDDPWRNFQQMAFAALIIGFRMSASVMRMLRSTLLEVLRQDYIRTAWAKGLRERVVVSRHALRNAFIPVITMIGNQFLLLVGGTVIIETIFSLPGMGQLTFSSIQRRDYPQIQANVLLIASFIVLVNLVVDLSYAWLDPRIRYR